MKSMGFKYRGAAVNKLMVLCACHVRELFDDALCLSALKMLEREFGRDLISNQYSKLARVLAVIKTHAPSVAPAGKIKELRSI